MHFFWALTQQTSFQTSKWGTLWVFFLQWWYMVTLKYMPIFACVCFCCRSLWRICTGHRLAREWCWYSNVALWIPLSSPDTLNTTAVSFFRSLAVIFPIAFLFHTPAVTYTSTYFTLPCCINVHMICTVPSMVFWHADHMLWSIVKD